MSTAIKVENLSKIYRLGEIGTGTISRDLERWVKMNVLGKDDPFLKIGESNDRSQKGGSDLVYSLQDLNFEIQQGDAVGIIGRNGAGKSTLLKILSRVTTPTTGKINIKGRVASLLEVGTGFHPELTGRENIYLNGAILGMRKREIDRKFDEIVDFSGVERYIDTPVKRYSSGMYVRLAFAVAAHLESEILIVDEVLAVGDAEFQKKCLGKMGDISKGEGRTVLFVSHNITAINQFCNKGLLIEKGKLKKTGPASSVINEYTNFESCLNFRKEIILIKKPIITSIIVSNYLLSKGILELKVTFNSPFILYKPNIGVTMRNILGTPIFGTNCKIHPPKTSEDLISGVAILRCKLNLLSGGYKLSVYLGDIAGDYDKIEDVINFFYDNPTSSHLANDILDIGAQNVDANWIISKT